MSKQAVVVSVVFVLFITASTPLQAADQTTDRSPHIEIFTTENQPISRVDVFLDTDPRATLHIHKLDVIERLESELSSGLSVIPENAKRQALQRLQRLSSTEIERLERSARSLAVAMQLGIQKYPAIVFDREVVIYGVTDLVLALTHYRKWQDQHL